MLALRAMVVKLVSEPAVPELLETLLYMHILRPYPLLTKSGTPGIGLAICVLASIPSKANTHYSLRTIILENYNAH